MPAKSDGSPWIKLKKSCVETPNRAAYALFCAISMERIGGPSIRLNALSLPPSSRIATFSRTPLSLAFATASSTIFCASSEEMLCFFTTLAIGLPPPLDMYCVLIIPALRAIEAACPVLRNHSRWPAISSPSRGGQPAHHWDGQLPPPSQTRACGIAALGSSDTTPRTGPGPSDIRPLKRIRNKQLLIATPGQRFTTGPPVEPLSPELSDSAIKLPQTPEVRRAPVVLVVAPQPRVER